jgi:hypothetical protein
MKETAPMSVRADLTELFERARRAREESVRLSGERRFIVTWRLRRPRGAVHPAPLLDGED